METNWCVLRIDDDNMHASIALKLPEGDDITPISPEIIEAFIRNQGINAGINHDAINAISSTVGYCRFVEIASGKPAINGADGFFEFLVPVEDSKSKPVINEDGSVDYYNSLKLAEVKMDELFAKYIHPTKGEYGYDIFSKMLIPTPGRELPPLRGKGFYRGEDKDEYYSKYNGHITREDNNKINIDKVYIVNNDLNLDNGNINFDGDVEIRGDVRSGLAIQSGGSVFIHGHVGACMINAAGNITIQKGIQGRNRCNITAGGDVICKFVERCSISSGGSIFADSILDSVITARNEVRVVSKSGIIIGGTITGMLGITAKEAGNESEAFTLLQAGASKEDLQKICFLTEQINKLDNDMKLLNEQLKKYSMVINKSNSDKISEFRQKVLRVKVTVNANRNTLNDELLALNEHVENARKNAYIHITGISHPGIRINIENTYYNVTEAFKDVVYRMHFGELIAMGADEKSS